MAVWQVDFYVIKQSNARLYNEAISFDDNEELLSWERAKINKASLISIADVLPAETSWSKKIEQYGNLDETCLKIFSIDKQLCQISFRLDVRSITRVIIYEVVNFITANNGIIVYNNKCYDADEKILIDIIKESNASKFCKDPEGFLSNLTDEFEF